MKIAECVCGVEQLKCLYGSHHKRGCHLYKRRRSIMSRVSYYLTRRPMWTANTTHSLFFELTCNRGGVNSVRFTLWPQYTDGGLCYGYVAQFGINYKREYRRGKMQILQVNIVSEAQEYLEQFMIDELRLFKWRISDQTALGGDVLWIPPKDDSDDRNRLPEM